MSNLHRLLWIDGQVRSKQYPNCKRIADEFEISIRQASRDIEYLRYSMNAPILYSTKDNGYYYEDETFILPSLFITKEEKETLNYLAEQYRGFGSSQSLHLAELFEKISYLDVVTQKDIRGNIPIDIPLSFIKTHQLLTEAMKSMQKIEMTYFNATGTRSKRIIDPYSWINRYGKHYVVAFCEKKKEVRVFRLDRIKEIRLLNEPFTVSEKYNPDIYEIEKAFNSREPFTASIQFASEDNTKILEFYNVKEFINSLLSNYSEFTILRPSWLKQALQERLTKLLQKNST